MKDLKVGDVIDFPQRGVSKIFQIRSAAVGLKRGAGALWRIEKITDEVIQLKPVPPGDQVAESKENHV